MHQKPRAKDLMCLFADLVEIYSQAGTKILRDKGNASLTACEQSGNLKRLKDRIPLQFTQQESHQKSQLITGLNNQIVRMQRHLEDRRTEMENLKKLTQSEQRRENEFLRKQWHTRFDSQQKRIDAIVELAKAERAIRSMGPELRMLPIIVLTASAIEGTREQCLEAGMGGYLTKSLKLQRLKELLNEWLGE
jgi:CheY-like chemotaxis protein